jgi:hypothetical protein
MALFLTPQISDLSSRVTEVGIEPTGTRLSTSPLCLFAYPAGCE